MKKKESKVLALILMFAMVMSVSVFMTSCSSDPSTLEEYVSQDEDLKDQLDSLANSQEGMAVEIKDNQIIYTYTYPQQIDESVLDDAKEQLESAMDSMGSSFESIASSCEEQTGIKGVTVKVSYLNNDGSELVTKEYSAAE